MALFDTIRAGASAASTDYEIERSVRFNSGDSAHFSRTLSSEGNKRLWTWSGWLKIGKQPSNQRFIFSQRTSSSNQCNIQYSENGRFRFESGGGKGNAFTQGQFRDPSAWYHLVVTLDSDNSTANDRIIIYVNGERQGLDISPTIATGDHGINNNNAQVLGREADTNSLEYDGYMAEVHFIDGARKAPSDFAETDSITGEYKPIEYEGTYGSQGWYYNFSDNSNNTASTLGKDYSGNGNNTTPGNISVSSGSGNDSVTDTPTNNWCTFNALLNSSNNTLNDGNLKSVGNTSSDNGNDRASFSMKTGKWYAEFKITGTASSIYPQIGVVHLRDADRPNNAAPQAGYSSSMIFGSLSGIYMANGNKQINNSSSSFGNSFTTNDIIGVAFDADNGAVYFSKNGTFQNSGNPASGSSKTGALLTWTPSDTIEHYMSVANYNGSGTEANFGQQGFTYTPPAGYVALNSQNLPACTATPGSQYINTVTYTANRTARSITGVGFQPDWVWIKSRDASQDHAKFDAVRGVHKSLKSNDSFQEQNFSNTLTSFDSDGFSLGNDSNVGNVNYAQVSHVAWNWFAGGSTVTNTDGNISSQVRASTTAGISIVTYTGNGGSTTTVGHGLNVVPNVIIVKSRSTNDGWAIFHSSLGATKYLAFEDDSSPTTSSSTWNNTSPTSSVFTINTNSRVNSSTGHVAYCFSEVAGYSKFGSYTGNGNSNGAFVFTGFRPAWIMVKRTSASENWAVWDSVRDSGSNPNGFLLRPDTVSSEGGNVSAHQIDIVSNGFKLRNTDSKGNGSGSVYVYFAFAELPFKFARAR